MSLFDVGANASTAQPTEDHQTMRAALSEQGLGLRDDTDKGLTTTETTETMTATTTATALTETIDATTAPIAPSTEDNNVAPTSNCGTLTPTPTSTPATASGGAGGDDDGGGVDLPSRSAKLPVAIVVVGMAGAGKTTFVAALYSYLALTLKKRVYAINLDPAVDAVPFPANIDIRDSVNYRNVMKEYGLGPNGGILTCLNLYATRFDQVLSLISKRCKTDTNDGAERGGLDYVLVDTPGQIEVFNWSASGTIILDALALTIPTTIAFLIDSVRCQRPTTLMANMMYACSVLYKSKLPFLGVFTKFDLADPEPQMRLLNDPLAFVHAAEEEDTYAATLSKSCALTLAPFYESFPRVKVAVRGQGQGPSAAVSTTGDGDGNGEISKDAVTLDFAQLAGLAGTGVFGFEKLVQQVDLLKEEYFDLYLGWIRQERQRMKRVKNDKGVENYETWRKEAAVPSAAIAADGSRGCRQDPFSNSMEANLGRRSGPSLPAAEKLPTRTIEKLVERKAINPRFWDVDQELGDEGGREGLGKKPVASKLPSTIGASELDEESDEESDDDVDEAEELRLLAEIRAKKAALPTKQTDIA